MKIGQIIKLVISILETIIPFLEDSKEKEDEKKEQKQ